MPTLKTENIKVLLGAHNISDAAEPCRKEFEIEGIVIHKGWNPDIADLTYDIALMKLKAKIKFTRIIFPICLKSSSKVSYVEVGTVVGYGEYYATKLTVFDISREVKRLTFDSKS